MSKEDPKPGRWILPVVIVALIGFTYVFVNALPAADVAASTSTTEATTTTSVPDPTTTTTLGNDILAFIQEVERFGTAATELDAQLIEVNDAWDARDISAEDALSGFTAVRDGAQDLANQVAATAVPDPFTPAWPDTITDAQALVTAADAVIAGFEAPDDGTLRREAVEGYSATTVAFQDQLDVVTSLTP